MQENEIIDLLVNDPGNSVFAEYAEELYRNYHLEAAMLACLKGLSLNPSNKLGRLILAQVYYDLDCLPFCIDQLKILYKYMRSSESLKKLLEKFAPQEFNQKTLNLSEVIETVAEAEFEIDDLELTEDKK